MRVYLLGEQYRAQPTHRMFVAPAADVRNEEIPADWVDDENNPVSIPVEFRFGEAEVPTNLGKFLVSRGLVARSRLFMPRRLSA